MSWIVHAVGSVFILLTLADIYLTVLYTRAGASLVSMRLYHALWRLFRRAARMVPRHKDAILSFSGPTLLVTVVAVWFLALLVGLALVIWPALGSAIQASQGATSTDFATALYYSGYGLTTLGTGDIVPKTDIYRLLLVVQAVIGFSVLTLTLTYFMSVYNAIQRRNSFEIALHHQTADTADAVELLVRLGAGGNVDSARQELATLAGGACAVVCVPSELSHCAFLSFSTTVLCACTDVVALHGYSQPPAKRTGSAAASRGDARNCNGAVVGRWAAIAARSRPGFLPTAALVVWREHYCRAVLRLQQEGIATPDDLEAGASRYIALRQQWNSHVVAFADYMAYS